MAAWRNRLGKHHVALREKWLRLGEAYRRGDMAVEPAKVDLRAAIAERLKEDAQLWHGWYRRHGGEFELKSTITSAAAMPPRCCWRWRPWVCSGGWPCSGRWCGTVIKGSRA